MADTLVCCNKESIDFIIPGSPCDSGVGESCSYKVNSFECDAIPMVQSKCQITNSSKPVMIIKDYLEKIEGKENSDDPFYVADIGEVVRQFNNWQLKLPNVHPFYAIKCNPEPIIIKALAKMGAGFDCASKHEIQTVIKLNPTIDPATSIIYANPCKAASHIRYAASVGVRVMTFDNADELYKVKKNHPNPQMILRVLTDDSKSICRFGIKFGAAIDLVPELLQLARDINIDVIGVSFHVGSGCCDANLFAHAIQTARQAFDIGESMGFNFTVLDIGGGFPGADSHTGVSFCQIANVVDVNLQALFPNTRVISEPGRYFASSAYTLAVNVHARRIVDGLEKKFMYYINEGVYSGLNCIFFDHVNPKPKVLVKNGDFLHGKQHTDDLHDCSIWGPTCDSMDMITNSVKLPELKVGDWLYFDSMGAYTVSAATTFNGFAKCTVVWTNTEASFQI